jgi:hypothetical protein
LVTMSAAFAVYLVELQMTSCASLMHKMYAQIDLLVTLAPTDRAFRPSDASSANTGVGAV